VKKIVTVVGARPQLVKAAALSRALRADARAPEVLVHTGQHYDPRLSDAFFRELDLSPPAHHLGVGSGTHAEQTGAMLRGIERVILEERPSVVLVYGDTNSTLAGALAAAKLRVPIAHVEAGLRSFNRSMPEEINRILTDHVSAALFCPTRTAVANLAAEGIHAGVHHVGDVMLDIALDAGRRSESESRFRHDAELRGGEFVLATVHRPENTDDPARLEAIARALVAMSAEVRVVFPVHPRTRARLDALRVDLSPVRRIEPVGLIDMAFLERHASVIVTDSGGVQKEAYFHRRPCVTLRTESEWVETIEAGWNRLATPGDAEAIVATVRAARGSRPTRTITDYGDGGAAARIAGLLGDMP
jgi:UDP-GlcNAc3NAcA epimerase